MNSVEFYKAAVCKRLLLKVISGSSYLRYEGPVQEFKVLEISPSGNWLKLMNTNGNKFWRAIAEISFVEELLDIKADRPK